MCNTYRPCTEPKTRITGASAKIHVIKVKVKSRVEAHVFPDQQRFFCGEKNTVHQFAFGWYVAKNGNTTERRLAMSNRPAEICLIVLGKRGIDECPSGLVRQSSPIAGYPDYVIGLQSIDDPIAEKIIVDPDVIMNENEQIGTVHCDNPRVVNVGQAAPVFKSNAGDQPFIVMQTLQGNTKGRLIPEFGF